MDENAGGGGNAGLYFIVGGLVVAVGLGAFAYSGGYLGNGKTTTEKTTISVPLLGTTTTTTTTEKSTH